MLHVFPVAELDERTTFPPWQNVVGPPAVATGIGLLFTVTDTGDDIAVQPLELVTVTL